MIVGAFDLHRGQITFDYVDMELGEVRRGRIAPADRAHLREWLLRFDGQEAEFAVEGSTGWRYVVEELVRVGVVPYLAEPADSAALRGRKKRAKTDRTDSTMLREVLADGRLPKSGIPPTEVLEVRAKLRLYKDLADERVGWIQRLPRADGAAWGRTYHRVCVRLHHVRWASCQGHLVWRVGAYHRCPSAARWLACVVPPPGCAGPARMLFARRAPEDAQLARDLLGQALATARELGLANVEPRAVALLA